LKKAIRLLRKATEIDAGDPAGWALLGEAYNLSGRGTSALAALRKSVELKENQPHVHLVIGNILLNRSDNKGALAAFQKVLEYNTGMSRAQYGKGLALAQLGRTDEAIDAMQRAANLFEAELREIGGYPNTKAAVKEIDQFLETTYFNLAILAMRMKNNARAEGALKKLLKRSPKNHEALNELGKVYIAAYKTKEAVDAFKRAITLSPENAEYFYNLGNAYAQAVDYGSALLNYRKAISLKGDFAWAHNAIGEVLRVKGDFDGALDAYKKAVGIDPREPSPYLGIARIEHNRGNTANALKVLEMAHALDETKPEVIELLADMHGDLGDFGNAAAYYKQAVEAKGDKPKIAEKLESIRVFQGLRKKAGRSLKDAQAKMKWESALEIESAHFKIKADVAPEVAEYALGLSEKIYKAYRKMFKITGSTSIKCKIYFFKNNSEYQDYCRKFHKDLVDNAGFYDSAQNLIVLYKRRGPCVAKIRQIFAHEILHSVMRSSFKTDFKSWLHEGSAEYWQLSTFEKDKPVIGGRNGKRLRAAAGLIRGGKAKKLIELFALEDKDFHGPRHGDVYSQVYSVVYFLMETKKDAFLAYLDSLRTSDRGAEDHAHKFAKKHFGSIKKMEKAWKAFVLKQ
jgi:Flp pilus assembly protein TadD